MFASASCLRIGHASPRRETGAVAAIVTRTFAICAPSTAAAAVFATPGAGAFTIAAVTSAAAAVRALPRLTRAVSAPSTAAGAVRASLANGAALVSAMATATVSARIQ